MSPARTDPTGAIEIAAAHDATGFNVGTGRSVETDPSNAGIAMAIEEAGPKGVAGDRGGEIGIGIRQGVAAKSSARGASHRRPCQTSTSRWFRMKKGSNHSHGKSK